ncbi:uncharacterized protein BXZ73DRAFT_87583 [Epithele typhae]|uniref:uncharacterized protein n=1 Tax=Epithele typhae TaxID=378194 RepID=UPI00200791E3|nr:uncharacterized protein BXZ73DRAFT_87583 [Epithele typhae]KAH9943195.1 hypothetical protein BXZ73DRAFT_87583 [Epithele typhae]
MNANLEEAANVATEYLSSLENLPQETAFILGEIRFLDDQVKGECRMFIHDSLAKKTHQYFSHSLKAPGQALGGKQEAIPGAVAAMYAELGVLSREKVALATRLVKLFERAMARLQHDVQKILKLQGDEPGLPPTKHFLATVDDTVRQLESSLRAAVTSAVATPVETPPALAPTGPPPPKKQRRQATTVPSSAVIKLPSPVPVAASANNGSASGVQRSGLSRQVHPRQSPVHSRRKHASAGPDDEDAEGEDDMEDGGEDGADAEDQELYCYCQKLSYGEMIACDNESCRYQWFHLSCINVKPGSSLPDEWYCEDCRAKLGIQDTFTPTPPAAAATSGGRKGRKKQ